MKLTDKTCKTAKPKEKPYKLADGGGMYLEVMPTGSKCWRSQTSRPYLQTPIQSSHKSKETAP